MSFTQKTFTVVESMQRMDSDPDNLPRKRRRAYQPDSDDEEKRVCSRGMDYEEEGSQAQNNKTKHDWVPHFFQGSLFDEKRLN